MLLLLLLLLLMVVADLWAGGLDRGFHAMDADDRGAPGATTTANVLVLHAVNSLDLDFLSLDSVPDLGLDLDWTAVSRPSLTASSTFTTSSDGLLAPPDYYACAGGQLSSSANPADHPSLALPGDLGAATIRFRLTRAQPLRHPQRARPSPPANRRPRTLPLRAATPIAPPLMSQHSSSSSSNRKLPETNHEPFDHDSIMAMLEGLSGDVNLDGLLDLQSTGGHLTGSTASSNTAASAVNPLSNARHAKRQSMLVDAASSARSGSNNNNSSSSSRKERALTAAAIFKGDPMDEEDERRINTRRRVYLRRQNATTTAGRRANADAGGSNNYMMGQSDEEMDEAEERKLNDLRCLLMQTIGGQPGACNESEPSVPFPGEAKSSAPLPPLVATNAAPARRGRAGTARPPQPPPSSLPALPGASLSKTSSSTGSTTRETCSEQATHSDNTSEHQAAMDYAITDEATENLKAMIQALEAAGQDPEKIARQVHIFQIIQANVAQNTQQMYRRMNAKEITRQGISAPRYIIGSAQVEVQSLRRPLIDPNAGPGDDGAASGRQETSQEATTTAAAATAGHGGDSLRKQFRTFGKKIKNTVGKKLNSDGRLMPHLTIDQQREYILRQQQLHEQLVNQMKQAALVINRVLENSSSNNGGNGGSEARAATEASGGGLGTESNSSRSFAVGAPPPGFLCSDDASSQRSGRSGNSGHSHGGGGGDGRLGEAAASADSLPLADQEDITEEESILRQQQQHLLVQQQQLQQQHQYLQQQLLLLQQRQAQEDAEAQREASTSTPASTHSAEPAVKERAHGHARQASLGKTAAGLAPDPQRTSANSISALLPPDPATMIMANGKGAASIYSAGKGAASSMDSLVAQITAALGPNQPENKRGGTSKSAGAMTPSNLREELTRDTDAAEHAAPNNEAIPPPPVHRPPPAPSDVETPRKDSAGPRSTVLTTVAGSYRSSMAAATTTSPAAKKAARQSQRFSRLMMPQTPVVEAVWSTTSNDAASTSASNKATSGQKKLAPLTEGDAAAKQAASPPADFLASNEPDEKKEEEEEEAEVNIAVPSIVESTAADRKDKEPATDDVADEDDHGTPKGSSKSVKAATLDVGDKSDYLQLLPALQTISPFTILPELQAATSSTAQSGNGAGKSMLSESFSSSGYDDDEDEEQEKQEAHEHGNDDSLDSMARSQVDDDEEEEEEEEEQDANAISRGRSTSLASESEQRHEAHRRGSHASDRSRSRSRSRTRLARSNPGRHRNKRDTSGIFSAVRLRKRDSAMSVWSIDVPDQPPRPVAPPPVEPPVPRLTAEIVTLPGPSAARPEQTADATKEGDEGKAPMMSSAAHMASGVSINCGDSSVEWEPRPTNAPAASEAAVAVTTTITADEQGSGAAANGAHAINDMLQRLADTNPELLSEGYTGSIFDLWADDHTQEANDDDEEEEDEEMADKFDDVASMSPSVQPAKPVSLLTRSHSATANTAQSAREAGYRRLYTRVDIQPPLSAGRASTGGPIDCFPAMSRGRSATVDAIPPSNRRTAEHAHDMPQHTAEPSTDLFSVMVSTITGGGGGGSSDTTTRTRSHSITEGKQPNDGDAATAEQAATEGGDASSTRKKTNAASTTAKLDDLMKELVCV
ncbi:hypothetical protein SYNPS1DRAFT_27286 [Syncephalis pseudoplumigaleata]|uniref:Uncharacterized protein n=1 Tax=Syncephalis pseudoplumigaleata TaxID=1712513 RepID=A0A4P9Z3L0_9FUNG|nr:hypothetical protein SYNPS1DRAFT_27286 [Syncephalis pseudoplumigaleata]|eukprot:RKP27046.1 hypothetical protein SYNPS1DRAFT_27286 [Syncephalis pseudoplumigaleata]